jgi:uncharacterized protein (DUF2147 family)
MKRSPASYRSVALLVLTFLSAPAFPNEDQILGTWLSGDGDGWIEITRDAEGISGRIMGSPNDNPERSRVDDKNIDPELRNRELMGLNLFSGFHFDGDDRWIGGKIYDPNSGNTYRCIITVIDDDTLKMRGYIGVPIIGHTEFWTRKKE